MFLAMEVPFVSYPGRTATLQTVRIFFLVLVPLLLASQLARGQGAWELRVCAHPADLPASSQTEPGYDNRIAEVIADELGADLTFLWEPDGQTAVVRLLRGGECDLILGARDGVLNVSSTLPYYRTPFVFVYRQDSPFEVRSLDDEILKELRIATYPTSIPHSALIDHGFRENTVILRPGVGSFGADRFTPIIEALLAGEVDVAVLYGPDAGAYAQRISEELKIVPVSPEITLRGLQLVRTWTMAVRPGDEALRDRLNIVLAKRWDDIQEIFRAYGVPLVPLPRPLVPQLAHEGLVRIGAVLPLGTGNPAITDTIAKAAEIGVITAEDLLNREAATLGLTLDIVVADSSSLEATIRAARRLILTEGVTALVGGFDEAQTRALSEVADELGVLFFNIGSTADVLRGEGCRRNTFHVEGSAAMYLDGLVGWYSSLGARRWFLVSEATEQGRALLRRAEVAIAKAGGENVLVGSAEVIPGRYIFNDEIDRLREVGPDIVLLLMSPVDHELFLAQFASAGLEFAITGLSFPVMQSRVFLTRLQQVASGTPSYRAALWETTLEENGAGELIQRFAARSGEPMDPTGWSMYAAAKILFEAVARSGSVETPALVQYLESPDAQFDVHKGVQASFRPWDHQLRQPLFLVELDTDAQWGVSLDSRFALAQLIGELPASYPPGSTPVGILDQLGDGPEESRCRF